MGRVSRTSWNHTYYALSHLCLSFAASGTTDRVLLLSGTHQAILDCLSSIQQLLRQSAGLQDSGSSSSSSSALPTRPGDVVKVLVPAGSCGLILGRGGETVRAVSAETGCMISISPQELSRSLDYDRVVSWGAYGWVKACLRTKCLTARTVQAKHRLLHYLCLLHFNLPPAAGDCLWAPARTDTVREAGWP